MKKFLVLFALLGLFVTACDDDEEVNNEVVSGSGTPALSAKLNASEFAPGDTMTLTVTDVSGSDVTRGDIALGFTIINLTTGTYDNSMFVDFTETAVLSATATSVSVDFVIVEDAENYSLRLVVEAEGCTISGANQDFTITSDNGGDDDGGEGGGDTDLLTNEYAVYTDPTQSFVSSSQLESFTNAGGVNYTIMQCINKDGSGSSHPNSELAAEGWVLLNATEFHYGYGGHALPSTELSDGRFGVTTQNGYAQDNTKQQQNYCWMTAHNNGTDGSLYFQNVVEGGYFRMFSVFQDGYTQGNGDGSSRKIAAEAIKCCTGGVIPGWGPISQGTRVEVRAKVGGNRQGYNYAIKIKDNAGRDWPLGGEIDLLQNPVFTSDPSTTNNVYQGVYYGEVENHAHPEFQTNDVNPEDWNIYWAEIVDDTTVRLGINGEETLVVTNIDNIAYTWPFTDLYNTGRFYLVLETGVGVAVDTNDNEDYLISGEWADSSIKSIDFNGAQTNDTSPHMYVDWVRVWVNNPDTHATYTGNTNGTFF